jgi:hypothetical protein
MPTPTVFGFKKDSVFYIKALADETNHSVKNLLLSLFVIDKRGFYCLILGGKIILFAQSWSLLVI